MDANFHLNRMDHSSMNYFRGSSNRQYGSGIGTAIKMGLRGFVIPMAKKYVVPVAKTFIQNAAPEVLDVISGNSKAKAAMKRAVSKTVRQQVGGAKRGRGTKPLKLKKTIRRRRQNPVREKKQSTRRVTRGKKAHFRNVKRNKAVGRRSSKTKKQKPRSRQDFFSSIVDRA